MYEMAIDEDLSAPAFFDLADNAQQLWVEMFKRGKSVFFEREAAHVS
jgi:hypothetical protein